MKEGIKSVLSKLGSSYIIIDGLDECSHFPDKQFEDFCDFLAKLGRSRESEASTRVLVLSRPDYRAIGNALRGFPAIQIDAGANNGDIMSYISQRVDEINPDPSPEERVGFEDIKKLMFNHAGGLFLWVHFKINQFKEIGTVEDIMDALQDTTEGLDDLYGEEIKKVLNHTSKFVRDRALRALLWVTNSYRPLSKPELLDALSLKPGSKELNSRQRLPRNISLTTECSDLINEDNGYYRLRHASLKDFLLSDIPVLQAYATLQQQAHSVLSEFCLTYLNFEVFKTALATSPDELRKLQSEHPLLEYSASFGAQHFAECDSNGPSSIMQLMVQLLGNEAAMRLTIQMFQLEDFERGNWLLGKPTPLHFMAVFDLVDIAESMTSCRAFLASLDEFGHFPIEYSILFRCKRMSIWLLDRYSSLNNSHGKVTGTSLLNRCRVPLLHNAAGRDWPEVIKYLVSLGIDKNSRFSKPGRTALHRAVLAGANNSIRCLLDLGASPNIPASNYTTPLIVAASCANTDAVRVLLRSDANVNHRGEHEETALHWAATLGLVQMALDLLNHGADVNAKLSPKPKFCAETPLHCAIRSDSPEVVELLIRRGADLNAQCSPQPDWAGETPLHFAVRFNSLESLRILIKKGANLEVKCAVGNTPILAACHFGEVDFAQALVDGGANMIASNSIDGWSGLHAAARSGNIALIEFILKKSRPQTIINARNFEGETPLFSALQEKQQAAARILLDSGAQVNINSKSGLTPFQWAISAGCIDIARLLLNAHDASPTYWGSNGSMPVHEISRHGRSELLPLVPALRNDDLYDIHGNSPLHYAALSNQPRIIRELIVRFPSLKVSDLNLHNLTALHVAATRGAAQSVATLMDIDPSSQFIKDSMSKLPLHRAAEAGHVNCLNYLSASEMLQSQDSRGSTPLWLASRNGHLSVVKRLLEDGADINKSNTSGVSPALAALDNYHFGVASFLLDNGADPRKSDDTGNTLLHRAAAVGDEFFVEQLLTLGCDGTARLANGRTPFHLAFASGRSEVVEAFLDRDMAQPMKFSHQGQSLIHYAVKNSTPSIVEKLATLFSDIVKCQDNYGRDAMICAAENGRFDMIRSLCKVGLSVHGPDHALRPPLEIAAVYGFPKLAQILIHEGADLNDTRSIAWSLYQRDPLHLAIISRRPQTAKVLMNNGADPTKKDWIGLCAIDHALRHPSLSAVFDCWAGRRSYVPDDAAVIRKKARVAITKLLLTGVLMRPVERKPGTEAYEHLNCLAEGLLLLRAQGSLSQARLCYIELATRYANDVSRLCDICDENCIEPYYRCTVCGEMDLCQACYQECVSSPSSVSMPAHISARMQLGRDISPVLEILERFERRDTTEITRCLALVRDLVKVWATVRAETYARWAKWAKPSARWSPKGIPAWSLVNLVLELLDQTWIDRETGYMREDKRIEHIRYIRQEMHHIYQSLNPREEVTDVSCSGHEYIQIVHYDALPAEDRRQFSEDGGLKRGFFESILDQCASTAMEDEEKSSFPSRSRPMCSEQLPQLNEFAYMHPRSSIPGRNEDSLRTIRDQLLNADCGEIEDQQKFNSVREIAWELAHAILGIAFTGQSLQNEPC